MNDNEHKRKTRREIWDIVEEQLYIASKEKIEHMSISSRALLGDNLELEFYRHLIIGVIISAGRSKEFSWLKTDIFKAYCIAVGLDSEKVAQIILFTYESFSGKRQANFNLLEDE